MGKLLSRAHTMNSWLVVENLRNWRTLIGSLFHNNTNPLKRGFFENFFDQKMNFVKQIFLRFFAKYQNSAKMGIWNILQFYTNSFQEVQFVSFTITPR